MLMVSTPVGVALGLYEAWRVGWWLAALMLAMLTVVGTFSVLTVRRIRAERREEQLAADR